MINGSEASFLVVRHASRSTGISRVISAWFGRGKMFASATSSGRYKRGHFPIAPAAIARPALNPATANARGKFITSKRRAIRRRIRHLNPSQQTRRACLAVVNRWINRSLNSAASRATCPLTCHVIMLDHRALYGAADRGAYRASRRRTQLNRSGNFDQPLSIARRDEIGQLASRSQLMAAGIKQRDLKRTTFGKFVSRAG